MQRPVLLYQPRRRLGLVVLRTDAGQQRAGRAAAADQLSGILVPEDLRTRLTVRLALERGRLILGDNQITGLLQNPGWASRAGRNGRLAWKKKIEKGR